LDDQDTSLWDQSLIRRGRAVLERGLALQGRGAYLLQAAIASLHAEQPRPWDRILTLYEQLASVTGSPVVQLSRAVAVGEVDGADAALELVDGLDLDNYHYLHATRAELLRRLGRRREAHVALERALSLVRDPTERRFLERRLSELCESSDRGAA
jgi:RNA polymerase sigma-70 factor (ECF subfamily)